MIFVHARAVVAADKTCLLAQLAQKLRAAADKLQVLQTEEQDARTVAISAIAGPDAEPERYRGVPLEDLLVMKPEQRPASAAEGGPRFDLTPAQVEIQRLEECVRMLL